MQILTKACQKNWFPTCSVIVKMFEHRNLAKIEGKEAKKLSKIDQGKIIELGKKIQNYLMLVYL